MRRSGLAHLLSISGIGRTKRVVIYDNLLEKFSPGEVRVTLRYDLLDPEWLDRAVAILPDWLLRTPAQLS